MYSTSHATGPVLTVFPFASTPKAPAHVSQLLQNLLARHHPSRQYPSLRSKRNCSPRMMKNAAIAVKKPTIVTVTQSTLRSIALRIFPLVDLRECSLQRRDDSLIASCSQSTDEKDEYHTRTPFSFVSEIRDSVRKPKSGSNALFGASYADIVCVRLIVALSLAGDHEGG